MILIAILVIPLFKNEESGNLIHMILCLGLLGLALLSALVEVVMDLYTFIPYDLYEIGLNIVVEDKELKEELNRRKKEQ